VPVIGEVGDWYSIDNRYRESCPYREEPLCSCFNPLMGTGNYSAHRVIWSWYTGRWWMGCYIWYSEEGTGRGPSPPRHLLAVPNVTAHPSTASVPITVLLYNDPLLCGFNVPIKGLKLLSSSFVCFSFMLSFARHTVRHWSRWSLYRSPSSIYWSWVISWRRWGKNSGLLEKWP